MYLEHFGLKEPPFSLTPDTGFFYGSRSHQEALNVLLVALRTGEGVLKVIGEVGTGKTLLCRKLLSRLKGEFVTAYIPNPHLMSDEDLHHALARELGMEIENGLSVHRILQRITERLIRIATRGHRVVLCIDEAQTLGERSLEAIRLLSNLETEKRKLLQIVLFAQPELDRQLGGSELRQLRQRISFSYRLLPLDASSSRAYLEHRLAVSGYRGAPLISPLAHFLLHLVSAGVPRMLNILGHKALLRAFGRGERSLGWGHVLCALRDTESCFASAKFRFYRLLCWGLGMVLVAELTFFVLVKFGGIA